MYNKVITLFKVISNRKCNFGSNSPIIKK